MARRGVSDEQRRRTAIAGGQRMVARGERPLYRAAIEPTADDLRVTVVEMPWLVGTAPGRWEAVEVPPESFDVETR